MAPRANSLAAVTVLHMAAALVVATSGCARKTYDPVWATRPYPHDLHSTSVTDMQVFRRDTSIEIVNSTPRSYSDFDLWINQRYVSRIDALPAGQTIRLSLWNFHDEYGDAFNAGGFFRSYEPTPVRLVEIQPSQGQHMIGLIAIRTEPVTVKPEPGR